MESTYVATQEDVSSPQPNFPPNQENSAEEQVISNTAKRCSVEQMEDTELAPTLQQRPPPNKKALIQYSPEEAKHTLDTGVGQDGDEDDSTAEQGRKTSPRPQGCNTRLVSPEEEIPAMLIADEINFPRLPSPAKNLLSSPARTTQANSSPAPSVKTQQTAEKTPALVFIWRTPPQERSQQGSELFPDKGKPKLKHSTPRAPDSAPITRQGYRSGRLAEDFWTALGVPNIPPSTRKTLQVYPLLNKDQLSDQAEYLVDTRTSSGSTIARVHIAELLAGVPWTTTRAREHVVNEISHALHKVLIFNNNLSNPFQKWSQGRWFASWMEDSDGEHTCTIFASIAVLETKVKPRKGQNFKWHQVPTGIRGQTIAHASDSIAAVDTEVQQWFQMVGGQQVKGKMNVQESTSHTATSNPETTVPGAVTPANSHER